MPDDLQRYTEELTTLVTRDGEKISRFVDNTLNEESLPAWFTALSPAGQSQLLLQEIPGTDDCLADQLWDFAPKYFYSAVVGLPPLDRLAFLKN